MKVLLNPRSSAAYGQDFLGRVVANFCGLTILEASESRYRLPPSDLELVVSMNLDEQADADFVRSFPDDVPVVAHVHCQPNHYSSEQGVRLSSTMNHVRIGIVPARFHQKQMQEQFPKVDWRVVYNGIDRTRFRVASDTERRAARRIDEAF